jgi:hypothetical protein
MKPIIIIFLLACSFNAMATISSSIFKKENGEKESIYLKNHEPNLIGLRHDDNKKGMYLDFKLSLQYPLFKESFDEASNNSLSSLCNNAVFDDCHLYLSFTGRFAQYIDVGDSGRDSSPVVNKRFNPKVFFRLNNNDRGYLDIEYAHESNGNYISSNESYTALEDDLENMPKGDRAHAKDYISRGWDYWGITAKYIPQSIPQSLPGNKLSLYLTLSEYIGGIMQGTKEEYYSDWEAPRKITKRQQVNGFHIMAKWESNKEFTNWLKGYKVSIIYETGLSDFTKNNTFQFEATTRFYDIPFMFWYRNGYSSDLAQYYEKVESSGVSIELTTFE